MESVKMRPGGHNGLGSGGGWPDLEQRMFVHGRQNQSNSGPGSVNSGYVGYVG